MDSFRVASTDQPLSIAAGPGGNLWFTYFSSPKLGVCTPAGITSEVVVPNATNLFTGITSGPDGNLWVGGKNEILRLTAAGNLTRFPTLLVARDPYYMGKSMTVGVDGNVWFDNAFNIGRITPEGSTIEFPLPNQLTTNIARGPDGNIWFTGRINSAEIGKVTPDGEITKYAISSSADGIATGPDGNIWFTENAARKIGRFLLRP